MAVTGKLFGLAFKSMINGEINWTSHTIKAMLCTSAYTPNQDTHQYKSSVTNEAAGTGYTAGGVALAGKTVTYTAGTNTLILDASDTQWPDSTVTGRYLILFDDTPSTDATKPLIGYIDFGADVSTTAGVFTSVWDAAGILGFTTA
ncbi:hypothetical protein [Rhodococcus qingshengii]|uniref:hypothetical protein n=1 Tax=Rhodococcus qingshengii TaxID=334542 RepID=UPI001ADECF55|nr:hypothetical protein [Rhodococcus qingshengii]MCQ4148656.1 hypothetical protein [Rhodococcus qingshengii]